MVQLRECLRNISGFVLLLCALIANGGGYEYPVPERFLGFWALNPESCGNEGVGLGLNIAPEAIDVEGRRGTVISVHTGGTNSMALYAHFQEGPGCQVASMQFVLSPDGRELVERHANSEEDIVRYKCTVAGRERKDGSDPRRK